MRQVKFGGNVVLRVRPNELGLKTMLENHIMEHGKKAPPRVVETDADGYIKMRLWEFMNEFGSSVGPGLAFPFENPILMEITE